MEPNKSRKRPSKGIPHEVIASEQSCLIDALRAHGKQIGHAADCCWACGADTDGPPTRCHIKARCNGGEMKASNFLLLCDRCHADQPDGAPWLYQMAWLFSHRSRTESNIDRISRMRLVMPDDSVLTVLGVEDLIPESAASDALDELMLRGNVNTLKIPQ